MKYKIITKDDEVYDMLIYLTHFNEVYVPKSIDIKVIKKMIKSSKDKLALEDTKGGLKLKKDCEYDYNVYLKRVV